MREYHLTTRRLGFSRWAESDGDLARTLWGDAAVARYISAGGHFSGDKITARLAVEIENDRLYGVQYWPLFLQDSNTFVGCCGLRPHDLAGGVYEFGVHLRPDYWGGGYATEAGRAVIAYGLGNLGAADLFAGHHPQNEASAKMLLSLGFHYVCRAYYAPTGLMHPSYLYR